MNFRKEIFDTFASVQADESRVPQDVIDKEVEYVFKNIPKRLASVLRHYVFPDAFDLHISAEWSGTARVTLSDENFVRHILPRVQSKLDELTIKSFIKVIEGEGYVLAIPITELKRFCNFDKLQSMK